ncbi:PREDICTED: 50S ribosomal protein 6, chloroplastic [Nelumbo nucifera]|uniref:50S ribosomal protein 6, chloroplastic n=1 Tax=Nelumbo nucifera TaxID=4432 RepID=A0A1U7ZDX7_NELNU|nr:PREDICTED: 50S ribosomal protein 6, chloroplastic [Nelumbo nucifera]
MSVSALFGTRVMVPNKSLAVGAPKGGRAGGMGMVIECSSRPKKKATAHHMKTRPKKTQPWDVRRRPTVYPPLPPLPPDWTLAPSDDSAPPQPPLDNP